LTSAVERRPARLQPDDARVRTVTHPQATALLVA